MTTLCLCDYVESSADRQRQLATIALYLPPDNSPAWIEFTHPLAPLTDQPPLPRGPLPRPALHLRYQE